MDIHDHLQWKSRGKRSSRPEPNPDRDFDFDEITAAHALISLANSNGGFCSTAPPPLRCNIDLTTKKIQEPSCSNFWFKKKDIDSSNSLVTPPLLPLGPPQSKSPTSLRKTDSNSTIFHPKKKLKTFSCSTASDSATATADDEPNSPDSTLLLQGASHICLECGKVFKTHQSLGGHKTKHRRKIQTTTTTTVKIYECTYCHEQFSAGQALGGHMRKHYDYSVKKIKKPVENQLISPRSGRDDSRVTTSHVARLDFDLNTPAVEELDSEEVQFN